MKRHASILTAVFVSLFFPCSGSAEPAKVSLGVISALSGGMATIGTAVKNGVELARAEHPELFTRLEFHFEDDQFDAKKSLSAYQKLKDVDGISVLLGFGMILGHSVGPLADRDRIPLINFSFEAATAIQRKYVLRSMNHTAQYQRGFARYLTKQGHRTFSTIRTELSFFAAMANDFRDAVGADGEVHEVAALNPGETDFRAVILKLRAADGPVGLFLLPEQLDQFMKQSKELGFHALYFGTDLFESSASASAHPEMYEGALYPDNEASQDFRARYRRAYGNEAQMTFAGSAYDMTVLVGELVSTADQFDPDAFREAMRQVQAHPGVLGSYRYRDEPAFGAFFEYPTHVKRIENKRGVLVPGS